MKPSKYIAAFSLLHALAVCLTCPPVHAAQSSNNKGSPNTNSQWLADPERGWVRTDQRYQRDEGSRESSKSKPTRRKYPIEARDKNNRR